MFTGVHGLFVGFNNSWFVSSLRAFCLVIALSSEQHEDMSAALHWPTLTLAACNILIYFWRLFQLLFDRIAKITQESWEKDQGEETQASGQSQTWVCALDLQLMGCLLNPVS